MDTLLGYAHVSAIEDLYYIFWDMQLTTKSYKPHYVSVHLHVDSPFMAKLMYEKAQDYLYFDSDECDEAYEKDQNT